LVKSNLSPDHRLGEFLPRKIAIFRALVLGDLLCAVPAFRALRAALPMAEITLIGLPWARSFVDRFNHYIDHFIEFPGYPGLAERQPDIASIPAILVAAQARRFDLAIQMHGSGGVTNPLVMLFGARVNAGFFRPGELCPDESRFIPFPGHEPEVRQHLRLMEHLGIPSQGEQLEFPILEQDQRALAAVEAARELRPGAYACVHPGARLMSRRWLPERFAAVADGLARRGLQVVLTGSAGEAHLTRAVTQMMQANALDLAGQTSLGALAVLLRGSRLLVSNDTGVSHLAAALQVPSVVVASGGDPSRWAPLDDQRHRVVFQPIECRPCAYDECPIGHPCATAVTPDMLLAVADELLSAQVVQQSY
jgi:ADP-heptose:LPS heptosyltransferase